MNVYRTELEAMAALANKKHQGQWTIDRLNGWFVVVKRSTRKPSVEAWQHLNCAEESPKPRSN